MVDDELKNLLADCDSVIVYKPMVDEVDYKKVYVLKSALRKIKNKITLSQSKNTDPFATANKIKKQIGKAKTFLLIPGQKFDVHGTRQGRGLGWYDRFLSKTPKSWIKIGLANHSQFAFDRLKRQKWDVPMDWVIICGEDNSRYAIIR